MQEKVPVVTETDLDADSTYPQDREIACKVVKKLVDENGREIMAVSTEKPWAIETIEGLTDFDLLDEQLSELKQ